MLPCPIICPQVSLQEEELQHLKHQESERAKVLMELGSQRDRMALAIAQKLEKVREIKMTGAGGG